MVLVCFGAWAGSKAYKKWFLQQHLQPGGRLLEVISEPIKKVTQSYLYYFYLSLAYLLVRIKKMKKKEPAP